MPTIDPFGQLLQTQMMIDQDKFQRQKYDDMIARQMEQDALVAQDRMMQQQAQDVIGQTLQRQADVQMNAGPQLPGFQPQPDYRSLIGESIMRGGGNPALMPQLAPYTELMQPLATGGQPDVGLSTKQVFMVNKNDENDIQVAQMGLDESGNLNYVMPQGINKDDYKVAKETPWTARARDVGAANAKATDKIVLEDNKAVYDGAVNAKKSLVKIDKLINELETSDVLTGMGAEFGNVIARAMAQMGSDAARGISTDTQYVNALMGAEVFPLIKQLGIGARGMDTPAEREFLREVMTGTIPLNKDTLLKMARDRKQAEQMNVARYLEREKMGAYEGVRLPKLDFGGEQTGKTIVRTGRTKDGRKVVQYSDGTTEVE